MATYLTEPEYAAEPEGHERGCEWPVTLSDWRATVAPATNAQARQHGGAGKLYRIGLQFNPADHATLAAWARDPGHGYAHVDVEQGSLEDGSWASYALVYAPGEPWSAWGVTRRGDRLEVWRCATGETVGRHALMATALAALPHASDRRRAFPAMRADRVADRRCRIAHSGQTALAAEDPGDGSDKDTSLDRGRHHGGRRRAGAVDGAATDA